jgi:hypothetical protein
MQLSVKPDRMYLTQRVGRAHRIRQGHLTSGLTHTNEEHAAIRPLSPQAQRCAPLEGGES